MSAWRTGSFMSQAWWIDLIDRFDLVAHEVVDPIELGLELGVGFEIPTHDGIPLLTVRRPPCEPNATPLVKSSS